MSILDWFTFRSAKQRKRDEEHYQQWAFPYGQAQRTKVEAFLKQFSKETPKIALAAYLLAKEAMIGDWEDGLEGGITIDEAALRRGFAALKNILSGADAMTKGLYLALIEADFATDEQLHYPDAKDLRVRAEAIVNMIDSRK